MTTKDLSRELCEICGIEAKIIEDYNGNEYEIFPDFTQPENFVMLFNLKVNTNPFGNTLAYFITSDYRIIDTEGFLILLFKILKSEEECKVNKIKQAIKSEEWKYE